MVIEKYAKWLNSKLCERKENDQKREFRRLYNKLVDTGNLDLLCWCAPKRCHGDVIKTVLIKVLKIRGGQKIE
jgi:hypothetical protein